MGPLTKEHVLQHQCLLFIILQGALRSEGLLPHEYNLGQLDQKALGNELIYYKMFLHALRRHFLKIKIKQHLSNRMIFKKLAFWKLGTFCIYMLLIKVKWPFL